jgi:hypothetical protein
MMLFAVGLISRKYINLRPMRSTLQKRQTLSLPPSLILFMLVEALPIVTLFLILLLLFLLFTPQ